MSCRIELGEAESAESTNGVRRFGSVATDPVAPAQNRNLTVSKTVCSRFASDQAQLWELSAVRQPADGGLLSPPH